MSFLNREMSDVLDEIRIIEVAIDQLVTSPRVNTAHLMTNTHFVALVARRRELSRWLNRLLARLNQVRFLDTRELDPILFIGQTYLRIGYTIHVVKDLN